MSFVRSGRLKRGAEISGCVARRFYVRVNASAPADLLRQPLWTERRSASCLVCHDSSAVGLGALLCLRCRSCGLAT